MSMQARYTALGAALAADGIPLHFGDLKAEYHAALNGAIILDRAHEGRVQMSGPDRFDLLNRISTNNLAQIQPNQGMPTIFTTAVARIIDRVVAYYWDAETLLLLAGPGRGAAVQNYLQRNIFYNDDVRLANLAEATHQFALHGPQADAIMTALGLDTANIPDLHGAEITLAGTQVYAARLKPLSGAHWVLICREDAAGAVWDAVLAAGEDHGLQPAGGLTYNILRIWAGRPGIGFEVTGDYIPLEVGLFDEISFNKICYTGQEVIARMESRNRLAKTVVRLELDEHIPAPAELYHEGKSVGKITSSVVSPEDELFAMGVVKTGVATPGTALSTGDAKQVRVSERLGVQPPQIA